MGMLNWAERSADVKAKQILKILQNLNNSSKFERRIFETNVETREKMRSDNSYGIVHNFEFSVSVIFDTFWTVLSKS